MGLIRRRAKVLYIGPLPPHQGGSAIVAYQMLAGLATLGHVVTAIAPITKDTVHQGSRFAARHPEIAIHRFEVPYYDKDSYLIPSSASQDAEHYRARQTERIVHRVETVIEKDPPDVIVVGRGSFIWGMPDIAHAQGIPCILALHGSILTVLNGGLSETLTERVLSEQRKADLVIACARHMAARLRAAGYPKVHAIPSSVDTAMFHPGRKDDGLLKQLAIGSNNVVALHVSNLKPVKRPLHIVQSAATVLRHNPGFIYLIVGDGEYRISMTEACERAKIADRFRFTGWIEHWRLADYMRLADILVMPSKSEGLSLAYLEAMACARVVLSADHACARELLVDGETGLLFDGNDMDDLAAKCLLAADDKALRRAIGSRAQEYVFTHHALTDAVHDWSRSIGQLNDGRPAA